MEAKQTQGSSLGWLAILLTFLLLAGGIVGFFYLQKTMREGVLSADSKLGAVEAVATTAGAKSEDKEKDLKGVIHENQKLVVLLEIEGAEGDSLGSGFLYNEQGDIITNAHVVDGAQKVTVKMADSSLYKGTGIGMSRDMDIAVVRVAELAGTKPMKLKRDGKASVGDEVIAFGSPRGLENTVTTGIISGEGRNLEIPPYKYKNVYQTSAPIAPGNSGGPLVDQKTGAVVGVNSAGRNEGNIGFSIPIVDVLPVVENWSKNPAKDLAAATTTTGSDNLAAQMTADGESYQDSAEYLVQYFYGSLDSRDYVTAYSLMGSDWQGELSYETFRSGYLNTLGVEIKNITSTLEGKDSVVVTAIIRANERLDSGEERFSQYRVTYTVGFENNKMKIVKGTAEKIS